MTNQIAHPIGKEPCPYCRAKGEDNSGDNCIIYSNGGKYCFSCQKTVKRSDDLIVKKYSEIDFPVTDYSKEDWLRDKKLSYTTDPHGFRGFKESNL